MAGRINLEKLTILAKKAGLELVAVTDAEDLEEASRRFILWQEKGFAADLKYMLRDAKLQASPKRLLAEASTVICFALPYSRDERAATPKGFGKVARYAWGRDYHKILPSLMEDLVVALKAQVGDFKYRYFTDAVPLLERALAAKAGLGFIGKNTLLIKPKVGSMTLIAELICDLQITAPTLSLIAENCGTCSRCLQNCPTQAFESEYVLNAGKCISYLTIEKKGNLNIPERVMLADWIFGCDICQEVCPFNHSALKKKLPAADSRLEQDFGCGQSLDLKKVCLIENKDAFSRIFADSPVLRIKREGLIRNAICVAVNQNFFEIIPTLKQLAQSDVGNLVRQFAYWGFSELRKKEQGGLLDADRSFLEKGLADNLEVAEEVERILS